MAALTAAKYRGVSTGYEHDCSATVARIAGGVRIWAGSALTINRAGVASPLTPGAGKTFAGFAMQSKNPAADNRNETIRICTLGLLDLPVAGASASSLGRKVYATSTDDFSLNGAGNAVPVGILAGPSAEAGKWIVRFDAFFKAMGA